MTTPTIVGAGLAGLIAAHAWPRAMVVEAAKSPLAMHKALLRFRTDAVANLTGIEFRKVLVRKGLWSEGRYAAPTIRAANAYAQKCLGRLVGDRSIWNLDPVERFIAPEDFYERLVENVGDRIMWGAEFHFKGATGPLVSTAPLPNVLSSLGIEHPLTFQRAPISVERFRVPGADVYQTIYFPDPDLSVYRASITGDLLIVEAMATDGELAECELGEVFEAFGVSRSPEPLGAVKQHFGKIAPVDNTARKELLFRLTHEHGIYSLGRFATWKNLLLDDVVSDISHIKALMRANSQYDLRKAMV